MSCICDKGSVLKPIAEIQANFLYILLTVYGHDLLGLKNWQFRLAENDRKRESGLIKGCGLHSLKKVTSNIYLWIFLQINFYLKVRYWNYKFPRVNLFNKILPIHNQSYFVMNQHDSLNLAFFSLENYWNALLFN